MPDNEEIKEPQSKGVNRRQFITRTAAGAAGAVALTSVLDACGGSSSSAPATTTDAQALSTSAWKFGVISDTQWTNAPGTVWTSPAGTDTSDPNTSAMSIATQIQQQFIDAGVKFVVHVGDLADNTSSAVGNTGDDTRALYAQMLYNAGIGFFPLRGNHDDNYGGLAAEFQRIFPQTQTGLHNSTPADVLAMATTDPQVSSSQNSLLPMAKSGTTFQMGSNFSSPSSVWAGGSLAGLTYSFDYNNARFILLDQFTPATSNGSAPAGFDAGFGGGSPTTINLQQSWITGQLSGRAANSHAFVFSHKGLITCQHADGLFGSNPSQNLPYQNAFMASMAQYNAGYYMNGHDHIYDRALITSPDGTSKVMTILTASDSSKFYVPAGSGTNCKGNTISVSGGTSTASTPVPFGSTNDIYYNGTAVPPLPSRRTPITQELNTVGYYVFTVNGANVTGEYYSADVSAYSSSVSEMIVTTATGLNFVKRESFGYSLIGKQFEVGPSASYASGAVQLVYPMPASPAAVQIQDSSTSGTTAAILSGTNSSNQTDASKQPCSKVVTTGWMSKTGKALSDIVALSGINPYVNGGPQPDVYTLSVSCKSLTVSTAVMLCVLGSDGNWTNAVNLNSGGSSNFVNGPWKAGYALGTYGVDTKSNSVWAVVNYDGTFAIGSGS